MNTGGAERFLFHCRQALLHQHADAIEIDLGLSPDDLALLERIKVGNELPQFDSYGVSESGLAANLRRFLAPMGENAEGDVGRLADIIAGLSYGYRESCRQEAAWVMARVFLPTRYYDTARWHQDGKYYFGSHNVYKLAFALKGACTLFGDKAPDGNIIQKPIGGQGKGALFLVGEYDAAWHAEPPIHEPRIFVAMVAGSCAQIDQWRIACESAQKNPD